MHTVAFDLDDTLYDRSEPLRKALIKFTNDSQVDFNEFRQIFNIHSNIAFDQVKNNELTLVESHMARVKNTFKQLNKDITNEQAMEFQQLYEAQQQQIKLFPHINDIFDYLLSKNKQIIIITNGPIFHQRNKIKNLGLESYFSSDKIIVSGEEMIAKPDRRIFSIAEDRFNLEKSTTWYIGDSYEHDIVGANNSGWKSIWLNQKRIIVDNNLAHKTVYSTMELQSTLIELCG